MWEDDDKIEETDFEMEQEGDDRRPHSPAPSARSAAPGKRRVSRAEAQARREAEQIRKKKRRRRRVRRVLLMILLLLLTIVAAAGVFLWSKLSKMQHVDIAGSNIVVNTKADGSRVNLKGYTNIALFGVDARNGATIGKEMNADADIVLSINNWTGEIRLISVYRDTYLKVNEADDMYRKLTEAFYFYGPVEAMNTLNRNLDLDIEDYVAVNWAALANAINMLGGVEIPVTEEELPYLNGYITETAASTGLSTTQVAAAGTQTLDGVQAVSYCRIRYIGMDYARTERQRTVLMQMFAKAKSAGVRTLLSMLDEILPQVSSSLSGTELTWLCMNMIRYRIGESVGFPYDKIAMTVPGKNDCVVPQTLVSNVARMHQELFGESGYVPSQTVQEISNRITADTGVQ